MFFLFYVCKIIYCGLSAVPEVLKLISTNKISTKGVCMSKVFSMRTITMIGYVSNNEEVILTEKKTVYKNMLRLALLFFIFNPGISLANFQCKTVCEAEVGRIIDNFDSRSDFERNEFDGSCDLLGGESDIKFIYKSCVDSSWKGSDRTTQIDTCIKSETFYAEAVNEGSSPIRVKRASESLCEINIRKQYNTDIVCYNVGSYYENPVNLIKETTCTEI